MTYSETQKAQAARWKRATDTLPVEAKQPLRTCRKDGASVGPEYDFCLPSAYAAWSLLPEVRDPAVREDRFFRAR